MPKYFLKAFRTFVRLNEKDWREANLPWHLVVADSFHQTKPEVDKHLKLGNNLKTPEGYQNQAEIVEDFIPEGREFHVMKS